MHIIERNWAKKMQFYICIYAIFYIKYWNNFLKSLLSRFVSTSCAVPMHVYLFLYLHWRKCSDRHMYEYSTFHVPRTVHPIGVFQANKFKFRKQIKCYLYYRGILSIEIMVFEYLFHRFACVEYGCHLTRRDLMLYSYCCVLLRSVYWIHFVHCLFPFSR